MSKSDCNHKYVHFNRKSFWKRDGRDSKDIYEIDSFFCEKCLDQQDITKHCFLEENQSSFFEMYN